LSIYELPNPFGELTAQGTEMELFCPTPLDGFRRLRWKSQGKEKFLSNLTRVILPGPDANSRLCHHVAKGSLLGDGEDRLACRKVFVKLKWNLRAVSTLED